MLHLRMSVPAGLVEDVLAVLTHDPAVSGLARIPGASVQPPGDLVFAEVAREASNDVIDRLRDLRVQQEGSLAIEQVPTWLSRPAFDAEQLAPGSGADSVVWAEVTQRAYDDSELNWTYGSFMLLATLIASIAVVVDSQVLVIGAMVLGPEFGTIAALGVALVRRRWSLLATAARTLVVGFAIAIGGTTLLALLARASGWIARADVLGERPGTAFIYTPDRWSFVVALIAAAAGVLSVTSARLGGLSGVFISVTTVPAAGNLALGLTFGLAAEIRGSALQLGINLSAMALAGWATLALQQTIWGRISRQRARFVAGLRASRG